MISRVVVLVPNIFSHLHYIYIIVRPINVYVRHTSHLYPYWVFDMYRRKVWICCICSSIHIRPTVSCVFVVSWWRVVVGGRCDRLEWQYGEPICSQLCLVVPSGSPWFLVVPSGSQWFLLVPSVLQWYSVASNGFHCCPVNPNSSLCFHV